MKLKKIHKRLAFAMVTISLSGLFQGVFAQAPPGQVKKATGSQSAAPYAPGQQKKQPAPMPLIVIRGVGITIKIGSDGREYYKNSTGAYYWKGIDGRFYLEDKYRDKSAHYSSKDLDDWNKGKGNKGEKGNKGSKGKK